MNTELLKSIGSKLVGVAPALAGAVLAPNPVTVMSALGAIKRVLGLAPDAQEVEVESALVSDPEMRLKITVAENEFKTAMRKLENDELLARLSDVQNARGREVEITKATGRKDINLYAIAWTIIGGYLGMIGFLLFMVYSSVPIKDESGILFMLLGNLSTFAGMVMGYLYGTTKQSAEKTDMIHNSTPVK